MMTLPFVRRRQDRERREADLVARGAACIPEADAMRCGDGHYFNGRFAQTCPCGSEYGWSVEPTAIRTLLAEVKEGRDE